VENGKVLGVITRTDLLNILVGGPVIPDFFYSSKHLSHFSKKKNMASMLNERLPQRIISLFMDLGTIADTLKFKAYLVGGLVRDVLLKRDNFDVDIVIEGDGIKFAREFALSHDVRVRSHKKFGTAVLIFPDGFKVDVATARMEYYETPAAPPTVETSSLKLDLYRRDFTINTLAIELNKSEYGTLIDYFGGQKDLRDKVIRVLHNLSFVEDPTRILRAIRFEQRFGFRIGRLTLALIRNAVDIDCFKDLSGKRLFTELKLLLMENNPSLSIERMNEFNLLQVLAPDIIYTENMKNLFETIQEVISWYNLLYLEEPFEAWKVYWYGLTSFLDKDSLEILAGRLMMYDLDSKKMVSQRLNSESLSDDLYKLERKDNFSIYTLLTQYDTEILLFLMAKTGSESVKRYISNYFTKLKGIKVQTKGKVLQKMGFEPGPLYKEIFDRLLEAKLNEKVNTESDELQFIRERFGEHLKMKAEKVS
jgi:tRNA nucleotidyltransferase (CCA-adding enzyme)